VNLPPRTRHPAVLVLVLLAVAIAVGSPIAVRMLEEPCEETTLPSYLQLKPPLVARTRPVLKAAAAAAVDQLWAADGLQTEVSHPSRLPKRVSKRLLLVDVAWNTAPSFLIDKLLRKSHVLIEES